MKNENEATKICKHCQSEIPKKAKVCPNCRKKQGGKLKWIVLAILVIGIIGAALGGGSDEENKNENSTQSKEPKKEIEYTATTVNDMVKALDENAVGASDTYKDKYLEVTGKLGTIDSSGDYISLDSDDEFSLYNVQCFLKNDEQLEIVKTLKKGDTITVKGKCTDVGEVFGYSLDVDSIVQ